MGYSPWGHEVSNMTWHACMHALLLVVPGSRQETKLHPCYSVSARLEVKASEF